MLSRRIHVDWSSGCRRPCGEHLNLSVLLRHSGFCVTGSTGWIPYTICAGAHYVHRAQEGSCVN